MQATFDTKRSGSHLLPLAIIVLAVAAVITAGGITLRASSDDAPVARAVQRPAPMPAASSAQLGEGLVTGKTFVVAGHPRGYFGVGLGEGLLSGKHFAISHPAGYYSPGLGEGWLDNGRPLDTLPSNPPPMSRLGTPQ